MALEHCFSEMQDMAMKNFGFLPWICVSAVFINVSIKLGIGYRHGIAPCHYGCAAFQEGWEEGGNYLVIHEHHVNSVEMSISKCYLFVHFIHWKTPCVWLTLVVLCTLVAPNHSPKHGVSVIIFLFHPIAFQPLSIQTLVPFHMVFWKCSFQTSLPNSFECLWSLSILIVCLLMKPLM